MSIVQEVTDNIKRAMKNKDMEELSFLRMMKSELDLNKSQCEANKKPFDEVAVLRKMRKNAEEMDNKFEMNMLDLYLPKLMSEEEIESAVDTILSNSKLPKDRSSMGRMMGLFNKEYKSKADNGVVSRIVKEKLANG